MNDSDSTPRLLKVVQTAESIASHVADPELRSIAFDRLLQRLLRGADSALELERTEVARRPAPSPRSPRRTAKEGPTAWVESLRAEAFFSEPKTLSNVVERVRALGHNIESKNVTDPLEKLVQAKILRRERTAGNGGKRGVWSYSNY